MRTVEVGDVPRILEIYAPFIRDGAVSFETEVPDEEAFRQRVETIENRFPFLVWEEKDRVAGYAYASTHRERAAYRWAVETTIYMAPEARGKGIGVQLYSRLLHELTLRHFTIAYGIITLPNEASIALHRTCGFEHLTVHKNAGWKHGKWHDVLWMEKILNPFDPEPLEPFWGN
jgi:phosphinothricin acetyltransferase